MPGELNQVVLTSPNPAPPEGHDQRMVALVDARNAAPAVDVPPEITQARPAWLPEKFKTPEEMAASYTALEAKLGGPRADSGVTPPVDPLATPTEPEAAAVVQQAGLDMAALSAEYAKDGALSEASLAKLGAAGVTPTMVDTYIKGQEAIAAAFVADVKSATPGGAGKYDEMMAWAKVNLTPAEIAAYNAATETNSADQVKLAITGLGAKFTAAVGSEPALIGGHGAQAGGDVFASKAQMVEAMRDRRYNTDPAYRRSVAEKLGRSEIM